MRTPFASGLSLLVVLTLAAPAVARDGRRSQGRWWHGTCHDEFLGGPCEVKLEAKRGGYKREIKCKDGTGATWERGEWKEEYRDGPCLVKIEAKRDVYKEEIKCD